MFSVFSCLHVHTQENKDNKHSRCCELHITLKTTTRRRRSTARIARTKKKLFMIMEKFFLSVPLHMYKTKYQVCMYIVYAEATRANAQVYFSGLRIICHTLPTESAVLTSIYERENINLLYVCVNKNH